MSLFLFCLLVLPSEIPLTDFLSLHLHFVRACPKPGPGFPTFYVVILFMLNDLRQEVIVNIVDVGGTATITI